MTLFTANACRAQEEEDRLTQLLRSNVRAEIFPTPPDICGKLLYGFGGYHIFSLVNIDSSAAASNRATTSTVFQLPSRDYPGSGDREGVTSEAPTIATHFSADGKRILIRTLPPMSLDEVEHEFLYVYDIASKKLTRVPDAYSVEDAQWSPKGDALAWVYKVYRQAPKLMSWKLGAARPTLVDANSSLSGWALGPNDSIFFAVTPQGKVEPKSWSAKTWFSIFQKKPGEQPRLVMSDAILPMPSPDGRWLAFFNRSKNDRFSYRPQNLSDALCLSRLGNRTKSTLMKGKTPLSSVLWTPDSQNIIVTTKESPTSIQIQSFDIATRQWRTVTTLSSKPVAPPADSVSESWQSLRVSRDSKILYVVHSRIVQRSPQSVPNSLFPNAPDTIRYGSEIKTQTLYAIRLSNGEQIPIVALQGNAIFDWLDESA